MPAALLVSKSPPLCGELTVHGAKNSVLPILAATLLCRTPCVLHNCPDILDVTHTLQILRHLGCSCERSGSTLSIDPRGFAENAVPPALAGSMRASSLFLGALLARTGAAALTLPGGCPIGARPIDYHLQAFRALGASAEEEGGTVRCRTDRLHGARLRLPGPSVGATENILMAAALAKGTTRIENAAKEPEITDLCDFLTQMGAHISGGGTSTILIEGRETLHGCRYRPIPDRIEAGTLLCAAAMTEGSVLLRGVRPEHMRAVLYKLGESGVTLRESAAGLRLSGRATQPLQVRTLAYPGFPTDMQAPMMALALSLRGTSVFLETIFENRFMHAREMVRMGASIRIEDRIALVSGGHPLGGTSVTSTDLRGGAALMLCGLLAEGETTLHDPNGQIARGYEDLPGMLRTLGASVEEE